MSRKLTVTELAALRAEVERTSGDGWHVELTSIDGIPLAEYQPDPDPERAALIRQLRQAGYDGYAADLDAIEPQGSDPGLDISVAFDVADELDQRAADPGSGAVIIDQAARDEAADLARLIRAWANREDRA